MKQKIFARIGQSTPPFPGIPDRWARIHRYTFNDDGDSIKTEVLSTDGWREYDPATYRFTLDDEVFRVEEW